jgi:hypothetical protein
LFLPVHTRSGATQREACQACNTFCFTPIWPCHDKGLLPSSSDQAYHQSIKIHDIIDKIIRVLAFGRKKGFQLFSIEIMAINK